MKRTVITIITFFSVCISAGAQVFIVNDNIFQERMSEIKTTVLDSLTREPVPFASVYVIPSKDTTITNFTLTDAKGEATLEEVPLGSYVFHVEMMGYKPFVRERYFRDSHVDMGTILLQTDEFFLQAATVTDVGNPVVIKQDTVEFNASSFRVGANAMLKDLLKRMPGMEITEDGKVKFNGEEIDKLTVGGRTFFFNDQSTALNNLPASVVDKIRVIDRESEETRASGIEDGQREKVLDVALKKEYEQGWFGNAGLKGGTTVSSGQGDEPLRDDRGLLYNANALVSAYSEKDQLTVIANGQNIDNSNVVVIMVDEDGTRSSSGQGLSSAAQLGLNANTSRIKDVETTLSVNYKYTDTDSGTRADRTTYQNDGNLSSTTENIGKAYANSLNADMEFQKEQGKVWFHIRPGFRYSKNDSYDSSSSETAREGSFMNSSDNLSRSKSERKYADFDTDITFRELWGKKRRTVRLSFDTSYDGSTGESRESSVLKTASGTDSRSMTYDTEGSNTRLSGGLRYTEPFGDDWTLATSADFTWSRRGSTRDAFDAAGRNEYYSSVSISSSISQEYELTAQYKFGTNSWLTLGGNLTGMLNETYSKSFGVEGTTGKDEWSWFLTPTFRFQHNKGNDRFTVSGSGYGQRPSAAQMQPVLNIGNPSRLSVGNIYLKPYSYTSFFADWSRYEQAKFSNMNVYLYGQAYMHPISSAQWYDSEGIMYSVPVNSDKPTLSASLSGNYTTPLDKKKNWSITLSAAAAYSVSTTYQTKSVLAGLDKDSFDYSAFMADFWGGADGNRFYSGASGFDESRTLTFSPSAGLYIKYNQDRWYVSAEARTSGRISRYSLNPKADMNTLDTRFSVNGSYTTKHEFEFETDMSYLLYRGYAAGYGQPEWRWNAEISKNIGAFNLSVTVHDILNQTRNLTHTVTSNYEEDSYRLIMGRYILFGVKWNFGKMNAVHSQRAQQAAFNMVF